MNLTTALEAAEDRLLIAVLVQLTGDPGWLAEPYSSRFSSTGPSTSGLIAAPDQDNTDGAELAALRQTLHRALADVLAEGTEAATLTDDETLLDLARFVTGAELSHSYVDYLKQTLDPHPRRPVETRDGSGPSIVVIGAGFCGLSMAIRLRRLGLPFRLLEKHSDVGGVWLENSYPRCAVDSPNHIYSFSSAIKADWTRYFAQRDEILDYIRRSTEHEGIVDHIEFATEVTAMRWSDADQGWRLDVSTPEGTGVVTADIVIPALGSLNQPKYPDIPGIDEFDGPTFHTARWRHDVDLRGKRIGLIGNGSSGFQVGPHLAEIAHHLTSFQRSPAWAAPNPRVNTPVPDEVRWLLEHVPHYARWHRFSLYWSSGDAGYQNLVIDPTWEGPGISAANERVRRYLSDYLRAQVGNRDDLYEQLLPDYPPFTKRMVVDNGFYAALTAPNVTLATDDLLSATPHGLVTADGTHHQLDVIIFATGFHGTRFLWPTEVRGRSGRTPAEIAGRDDDIRAYLGTAMPDFPNLFTIFGPNSSIGHGGSAIHIAECQADYIAGCLAEMIEHGITTLECRRDVLTDYNAVLDRDLTRMVWSEPGVNSRYRNEEGRIVTNHPWTLQRFWELTRRPSLDDYHVNWRPHGARADDIERGATRRR